MSDETGHEPITLQGAGPLLAPPVVPEKPRATWVWGFLLALFTLLIGMRFLVSPEPAAHGFDDASADSTFRIALVSRQAGSLLSTRASSDALKAPSSRELKEVKDKVSPFAKTDTLAATYDLAIGRELGLEPDPAALELLEKGKPEEAAIARLYRDVPLGEDALATLEKNPPEGFVGKVVLSHAKSEATGRTVRAVDDVDVMKAGLGGLLMIGVAFLGLLVLALSPVLIKAFKKAGMIGPIERPDKSTGDRMAGRTVVFIVCFLAVMSFVPIALQGRLVTGVSSVIAYLALIGLVGFLSSQPFLGKGDTVREVFGRSDRKPALALMGAMAFAANIPIVFLTALIGTRLFPNMPAPHHPVSEMVGKDLNPVTVACLFVMVGVMAPIVEETAFRGYLFKGLLAYLKPVPSIALCGFLFAAIHPQGVLLWVPLALVGAMAAVLTGWTRSLLPAMVMHGLHNSFLLIVGFTVLGS
ncbi:MAG: CPBP family intramembrane metalloprotease [Armatimonadetes bacterium]|nr:CPBP family intramembrane metalloprotease [Armatimonadota bacterium]